MPDNLDMPSPDFSGVEVLTFDCYETLIDWESGILSSLRSVLGDGWLRRDSCGRRQARLDGHRYGDLYGEGAPLIRS